MSERSYRLSGSVVPLATPLRDDESLDAAALERMLERQRLAGSQAVFVLGSVGEGPLLPRTTRKEVVAIAVAQVGKEMPVLAGAMDNSVRLVLERIDELVAWGAHAAVVTLPSYGWFDNERSTIAFFRGIADRAAIPIVPYNLPRVVGFSIPDRIVHAIWDHPNIIGYKDTRPDLEAMRRLASEKRPDGFSYLPGNSSYAWELFQAGADGIVSTPANVMPELVENLWQAHLTGDQERGEKLRQALVLLCGILQQPNTAGGVKAALELKGICSRRTVHPWPQAEPEHMERVSEIIRSVEAMLA
ncbi:MAG: dihydrodipicolinate synthase family protein [Anaerolineae bacterium]